MEGHREDGDGNLQGCVKQECPSRRHGHPCSLAHSGAPPTVSSILPCPVPGTPTTIIFPLSESVTSALVGKVAIQPAPLSLPERPERGREAPSPSTTALPCPGTGLPTRQTSAQLGPHKEVGSRTGTEDSLPSASQASALRKTADESLASPKALPAGLEAAVINGSQEVF